MIVRSRRAFRSQIGVASSATLFTSYGAASEAATELDERAREALRLRIDVAKAESQTSVSEQRTNGDSERYPSYLATFSKSLNHNELGLVDPYDYQLLLKALESGKWADFESIPLGGKAKLSNPMTAFEYCLEGCDSHHTWTPPPPAFASDAQASELIELYWQALTRDIQFAEYDANNLIQQACTDLTRFGPDDDPRINNAVNPKTIFRVNFPGCLTGPYVSQFMWLDIPVDNIIVPQQYPSLGPATDQMTQYADFLSVQNGAIPKSTANLTAPRYMISARDLVAYVHRDFACQGYQNAALILSAFGTAALSDGNPYKLSKTQAGFSTYGLPGFVDWVGRAASAALKASWYHKWLVHRRIRPEEFGGRVHNKIVSKADFPISGKLFRSNSLDLIHRFYSTYLLPQAYPEGCPVHPSYPAAHATIAGTCVTVLKALFNEMFVIPNPVIPTPDGSSLEAYTGEPLTVGGELNKLAANIALARDAAGVHWRSDTLNGVLLGEAVGISLLRDWLSIMGDNQLPLTFHNFAGELVTVHPII